MPYLHLRRNPLGSKSSVPRHRVPLGTKAKMRIHCCRNTLARSVAYWNMSDLYQMIITGPGEDEKVTHKGTWEEILRQEKEAMDEFSRQGFTLSKHTMGFSGRHSSRAVEVSCEIRKVPG